MDETLKKLLEDIKAKQEEIQKAAKNSATREELEAMRAELAELKDQKQAEIIRGLEEKMQKQLESMLAQGEEIAKLREKHTAGTRFETPRQALIAALDAKTKEIAEIKAGGMKAPLRIEFKDAILESVENTIGAGSTQVTITQNTGIISRIRKRELRYLANVAVGSIGSSRALWIEELDEQGNPIFIGEGDAKTQLSVVYHEQTMAVKKIAVYTKMSTEFLEDLPQLVSFVLNNLGRRLDIKLEDQLFTGNGVGDNLKGITEYATAFVAPTALAANVQDANELDVLEAVALQCKNAFGIPEGCFITPSYMSKIKLIKDENGRPVWKDYVTITGEMVVSGMRIVETNALDGVVDDEDEPIDFIGGDLMAVNVLNRSEMAFQFGRDGNDFTQNKQTALLEKRLVQFVSANDTPVIIQGNFETAIAALEKAPAP